MNLFKLSAQNESYGMFVPAYENSKVLAEIGENLNQSDSLNIKFQSALVSYEELKKQSGAFYQEFYKNAEKDGMDSLFLDQIMKTNLALEKISNPESFAFNGTQTMEAVTKDFKIKTEMMKKGGEDVLSKRITITVITDGGEGYDVFAKYPWDGDIIRETFNNQTNDAQKPMIPGLYYIWISKNGRKVEGREVLVSYREKDTIQFKVN